MNKTFSLLIFTLLLSCVSSCGSLRLLPQGCQTNGVWGQKIEEGKAGSEIALTQTYYVWNMDQEVKLKKFLKEKNIECSEVKEMRVEIKSTFFVKRELIVFIQK